MDLGLYVRVLWRFRLLVVVGLLLAGSLAVLSLVRIDGDGVTYRDPELWASTTRLGVTQNGFPWGRLLAQEQSPGEAARNLAIPLADPNRLTTLAVLYAELATSDPVRRQMLREGAAGVCPQGNGLAAGSNGPQLCGRVVASAISAGENRVMLPLIDLTAIATSPRAAVELAQRAATAFGNYIRQQQVANKVPRGDRVVVEQLQLPKAPRIFQPRSKTLPVVVFLAVMLATVGLAFLLENLRPPRKPAADETLAETDAVRSELPSTARRTA